MRSVKPIGYTFVAIGILLGVLTLFGVIHPPVYVTVLPAIGVIVVLIAELRLRQTRE